MRRALNILRNTATILSTLLCAATVILWLRSYPIGDGVRWQGRNGTLCYVRSDRGLLHAMRTPYIYPKALPDTFLNRHGFIWFHEGSVLLAAIPHWFAAALFIALPAAAAARRWWRAHAQGLCPTCGYDLRATPKRCPECGATPVANAQ